MESEEDPDFYDAYEGGKLRRVMKDEDAKAAVESGQLSKKAKSAGCLWFAEVGTRYQKQNQGKYRGTLIEVTLTDKGKNIFKKPSIYLSHENEKYKGEAKHPKKFIVKANERGAFGLGLDVIAALNNGGIASIKAVAGGKNKKK